MQIARSRAADKPPAASEAEIQRALFQHLRVRGAKGVVAFAVPNGGYRRAAEAKILVGMGVRRGVPDIIAVHAGRCFALELKSSSGKLAPAQRETLALLAAAGAICGVTFGLDQALEWLERHGLLRGRAS